MPWMRKGRLLWSSERRRSSFVVSQVTIVGEALNKALLEQAGVQVSRPPSRRGAGERGVRGVLVSASLLRHLSGAHTRVRPWQKVAGCKNA